MIIINIRDTETLATIAETATHDCRDCDTATYRVPCRLLLRAAVSAEGEGPRIAAADALAEPADVWPARPACRVVCARSGVARTRKGFLGE